MIDLAKERSEILASGFVSREAILDQIVCESQLKSDLLWEQDPVLGNWHRRTAEFFAARSDSEETLRAKQEAAEIALGFTLLELGKDLPPQEDGPRYPFFLCGDHGYAYEEIASFKDGFAWPHLNSGSAIKAWKTNLPNYVSQHSGDVLWWRCRPEIQGRIPFGDTEAVWAVYSRLVIGSGTPEIAE